MPAGLLARLNTGCADARQWLWVALGFTRGHWEETVGGRSPSVIHLQVTVPVSVGPDLERIAISLVGEEGAEEKGREKEERKEEEEDG